MKRINEIKLTLSAIEQEKHEIRVKMRWIVCDLRKLGVDDIFLEELKDKANNAYETITDFEACVRALAENGQENAKSW